MPANQSTSRRGSPPALGAPRRAGRGGAAGWVPVPPAAAWPLVPCSRNKPTGAAAAGTPRVPAAPPGGIRLAWPVRRGLHAGRPARPRRGPPPPTTTAGSAAGTRATSPPARPRCAHASSTSAAGIGRDSGVPGRRIEGPAACERWARGADASRGGRGGGTWRGPARVRAAACRAALAMIPRWTTRRAPSHPPGSSAAARGSIRPTAIVFGPPSARKPRLYLLQKWASYKEKIGHISSHTFANWTSEHLQEYLR
jgi:hypothetical protein